MTLIFCLPLYYITTAFFNEVVNFDYFPSKYFMLKCKIVKKRVIIEKGFLATINEKLSIATDFGAIKKKIS